MGASPSFPKPQPRRSAPRPPRAHALSLVDTLDSLDAHQATAEVYLRLARGLRGAFKAAAGAQDTAWLGIMGSASVSCRASCLVAGGRLEFECGVGRWVRPPATAPELVAAATACATGAPLPPGSKTWLAHFLERAAGSREAAPEVARWLAGFGVPEHVSTQDAAAAAAAVSAAFPAYAGALLPSPSGSAGGSPADRRARWVAAITSPLLAEKLDVFGLGVALLVTLAASLGAPSRPGTEPSQTHAAMVPLVQLAAACCAASPEHRPALCQAARQFEEACVGRLLPPPSDLSREQEQHLPALPTAGRS